MNIFAILPHDVRHIIFTYCDDITRAGACSVSAQWYEDAVAVSMRLCPIPELYTITTCIPGKRALLAILGDYHLTVRYKLALDNRAFDVVNLSTRTIYKANNINVIRLYQKLHPRNMPTDDAFYAECLFEETFSTLSKLSIYGHELTSVCYTGNVNNIGEMLALMPRNSRSFAFVIDDIHTAARHGHIPAVKYLLNWGINGQCNHGGGLCDSESWCFTSRQYIRMVSKSKSDKASDGIIYVQSEKYNPSIEFLLNEHIPQIAALTNSHISNMYDDLARNFCKTGSLFGFKLALSKITISGNVCSDRENLSDYLVMSCKNDNMEITEYIMTLMDFELGSHSGNRDHNDLTFMLMHNHMRPVKAKYVAMEFYKRGLVPLDDILYILATDHKINVVNEFLDAISVARELSGATTTALNKAFAAAVKAGNKDAAEILIALGCPYDKKLYSMGIIALVGS